MWSFVGQDRDRVIFPSVGLGANTGGSTRMYSRRGLVFGRWWPVFARANHPKCSLKRGEIGVSFLRTA